MRQIVVSQITQDSAGWSKVTVWFRVLIPAADTTRISFYATQNANYVPQAPAPNGIAYTDTAGTAELSALRGGTYVETAPITDIIDPTMTAAQVEARLVNLLSHATTVVTNADNSRFQYYGTSYDGTTWTAQSA